MNPRPAADAVGVAFARALVSTDRERSRRPTSIWANCWSGTPSISMHCTSRA